MPIHYLQKLILRLDAYIVNGGFNADKFLHAITALVQKHMMPFPGPRSVLILDGCGIHHTREVHDAAAALCQSKPHRVRSGGL